MWIVMKTVIRSSEQSAWTAAQRLSLRPPIRGRKEQRLFSFLAVTRLIMYATHGERVKFEPTQIPGRISHDIHFLIPCQIHIQMDSDGLLVILVR